MKRTNRYDKPLRDITDYVMSYDASSQSQAMRTSHYCLLDSLGCAMFALAFPACTKLLGPVVEGANMTTRGARVVGTSYQLDPVRAAFNLGVLIRWLDYNDTWLAAEWGHPSDNLGGLLAIADYISRTNRYAGKEPIKMKELLAVVIKAHEIQGIIALENSFNRRGLDHTMLVRIASAATTCLLLRGTKEEVLSALSNAWIDGCALRTYRHAPNTGSRKSWAAGDATARGLQLALWAKKGEMGYPTALSAPVWGFNDVHMRGEPLVIKRKYGSYVMENILFKISFPAEFHAQTAAMAAIELHPKVYKRINDIKRIRIETQEAGKRIIDKTGPLHNPAARDHCIQYITAIALFKGSLSANDYEDNVAANPIVDKLRALMEVVENKQFTKDYFDPEKRAIGNAVQVFFNDGTKTPRIQVDYPLGHKKNRQKGIPLLKKKFTQAIASRLSDKKCDLLISLMDNPIRLQKMAVDEFIDLWVMP